MAADPDLVDEHADHERREQERKTDTRDDQVRDHDCRPSERSVRLRRHYRGAGTRPRVHRSDSRVQSRAVGVRLSGRVARASRISPIGIPTCGHTRMKATRRTTSRAYRR
ncbi:hypothetical protein GALL_436550 [mine drainage metagenome]|uniref:Uncharacterized protein n=1 Tax=mine drainage metagenome TaxID=410659 RepID=A0A1J5PT72_9ZZZZ